MDLADLRVLEAVSRHGSMNRAAQALHTVQSNITLRIRALEEELGLKLFQRHARGVTPTPAGLRLLPYAARLSKLLADAQAAARDEGEPAGPLTLGSLETTTALRLSPLLGDFAKAHPRVRLIVGTGTTRHLIDQVLACRLDGAFVAGPVDHPDLHQEAVFEEELVLASAPSLASLEALARVPELKTIVFQIGCSYRQILEAVLAERGIVTASPLEFGSLDAIVSCVAAGVGVTLLPRAVLAQAAGEGRVALHSLPAARARVATLFVRRHDAYVSSALGAFLAMARAQYGRTVR